MKRLFAAALVAGGLLFSLGTPAHAQAGLVAGNVWGVTAQGVYIQNTNGITFVPADEAEFVSDGLQVDLQYLEIGQPVNAYTDVVIPQGEYSPDAPPPVYAQPSVVLSLPFFRGHEHRGYRDRRYRYHDYRGHDYRDRGYRDRRDRYHDYRDRGQRRYQQRDGRQSRSHHRTFRSRTVVSRPQRPRPARLHAHARTVIHPNFSHSRYSRRSVRARPVFSRSRPERVYHRREHRREDHHRGGRSHRR